MLDTVIPSYAYQQYQDSPEVVAFFDAFNTMAQQYVDLFNTLNLPVYTGPQIVGALLDWVARGIYDVKRPALPGNSTRRTAGWLNTVPLNTTTFNGQANKITQSYYAVSDDIFKRILTWNLYKGDGTVFSVRWLKRRVLRFLTGINGTDPGVSQTYSVSVTFGLANQVNINVRGAKSSLVSGALFNLSKFNSVPLNSGKLNISKGSTYSASSILAAAIQAGALQLPFQFTYVVNIV